MGREELWELRWLGAIGGWYRSCSVRNGAVCRPARSFSKVARQVGLENRTDDILSSRPVIFQSCPTSRNQRRGWTALCRPVPSFPEFAR